MTLPDFRKADGQRQMDIAMAMKVSQSHVWRIECDPAGHRLNCTIKYLAACGWGVELWAVGENGERVQVKF